MPDQPLHFILCLERTGSTMLASMLNSSPKVISPTEDPFLLYFSSKYSNKSSWAKQELDQFVDELFLLQDINFNVYMHSKAEMKESLKQLVGNTSFLEVCKQVYLNFYPGRDKTEVETIIDKQIKYSYHLREVKRLMPNSKFAILIRHPLDNLASWRKRGMGKFQHALYLAEIWKYTFRKLHDFHLTYPEQTYIIRYEDLVQDPKKELEQLCAFFDIPFSDKMLTFHQKFNQFTEAAKEGAPNFIDYIEDFHSGLKSPANPENIGIANQYFSETEIAQIMNHCRVVINRYDYRDVDTKQTFSLWRSFWVIAARFKFIKLRFYRILPFGLKKQIRKWRPKQWPPEPGI